MQPAAILSVLVTANTSQAQRGLLKFNATMRATESSSNKALGALQTFGKGAAIGVGGALAYSVKKAADFEQQLDSLGAVTRASGRDMELFRKQAMKAGADTKFSALDAAQAQTELAKGGLSVRNILRGGLRSALALAAAGELDLGQAAATTANAMNLFGLRGKDSIKVADALAKAANATTADVSDFAMALTQGGGVAKTAGLSFRETVLALEALAKSGVKNSDAGTSLKTSLIQLLSPTAKQRELMKKLNIDFTDAAGNFKNLSDVSDMLREKTAGMTREQRLATFATLAGTDGVRTLTALYGAGSDRLDKWRQGLAETGTAADVAAKKQDNLKGRLENLQGSVETIAIAFGSKLLPVLTDAAEKVTDVLNDRSLSGSQKFDKLGQMFAKAIGDAGPKIGEAAAKVGLIAVQGFFNAFRNSPLWLKLLTAGFILSKLGAFQGAWKKAGIAAGTSMAAGVGEGVATSAKAGRFSRAAGAFKTIGKTVLGAALVSGIADAASRQGISGFGDRFQQFASTATFGVLPAPRDVDERLRSITDKIRTWRQGVLKLSDASDPDNSLIRADDLNDFTGRQKRMLAGLAELRNTATRLFGTSFRLNAKMEFNPERASKRLRELGNEFGRLRSGAVTDVRQLKDVVGANFKRIAETMGTNSKDGQQAVARNFRLAVANIVDFKKRGVLNASQAGELIARVMRNNTGRGKDALAKNMLEAQRAIARTMSKAGQITQEGTSLIRSLMISTMKNMGLSADTIRMSINKRESAKKGFTQPGQTGLVVTGGKPHGDSVHALLERGEVVINRKAVQRMGGPQAVNQINKDLPRFQSGGIAGMVSAANRLDKAAFPYLWGGGHQGSPAPFGAMDCSGAVSYVLQHGGVQIPTMVSGALMNAGQPGPGRVTVFANPEHTFMRIGNRYFGTSGSNPGGGAGWFPDPGQAYKSRFAQRHFKAGGDFATRVPKIEVNAPDSAIKTMVQGALDKTRAGANRKIRDAMSSSFGSGDIGDPGPLGGGGTPAKNLRLGKRMAAAYGWVKDQWNALKELWNRESGWSNTARNPSSGAFGIPQALPPTKMPKLAQQGDARSQIAWGLQYIKGRYGTPGAALAWHDAHNWYQKGGAVGYTGDSLGQGTAPKLKALIDRVVHANSVKGRQSSAGLGSLRQQAKHNSQLVFDLGTNDANTGQTRGSLSAAKKLGLPLHFFTVNSPFDAAGKNKMFRNAAGGNAHLVDWAGKSEGLLQPDGIHATSSGYAKRARMLAASIRRATGQEKKGGKDGLSRAQQRALRKPFGGSLGRVLNKTVKALGSKFPKIRSKRLKQFANKIKKSGDIPKGIKDRLALYSLHEGLAGTNADHAGQLNTELDDGRTVLGVYRGKDQGGWMNEQLTTLLSWRDTVLEAIKIATKRKKTMEKLLKQAREQRNRLQKVVKRVEKWLKAQRKNLAELRKHPKQNKDRIAKVRRDIVSVQGFQDGRQRQLKGYDKLIPLIRGRLVGDGGLNTMIGTLSGSDEGGLADLQGIGGSMRRFNGKVPAINEVGGRIFDVMASLRELQTKPSGGGATSEANDTQTELLRELLRQANLRTAVSERQFQTLRDFDRTSGMPFMGAFAKGGVALVGERGPELAHLPNGTRIHNASDTANLVSPNVSVHVYEGEGRAEVFIDDRKIDAAVERVTRRQARSAARRLPGRGGGV